MKNYSPYENILQTSQSRWNSVNERLRNVYGSTDRAVLKEKKRRLQNERMWAREKILNGLPISLRKVVPNDSQMHSYERLRIGKLNATPDNSRRDFFTEKQEQLGKPELSAVKRDHRKQDFREIKIPSPEFVDRKKGPREVKFHRRQSMMERNQKFQLPKVRTPPHTSHVSRRKQLQFHLLDLNDTSIHRINERITKASEGIYRIADKQPVNHRKPVNKFQKLKPLHVKKKRKYLCKSFLQENISRYKPREYIKLWLDNQKKYNPKPNQIFDALPPCIDGERVRKFDFFQLSKNFRKEKHEVFFQGRWSTDESTQSLFSEFHCR